MYLNDLTFYGSSAVEPEVVQVLVRHIEACAIRPRLAATSPLEELPAAQTAFIANAHVGNLVVAPSLEAQTPANAGSAQIGQLAALAFLVIRRDGAFWKQGFERPAVVFTRAS